MKSVTELLDKFNEFSITGSESSKHVTLKRGVIEIEVSYSIKAHTSSPTYPLQCVVRVATAGRVVYTWGCESNDDNYNVIVWFSMAETAAYQAENKLRDEDEKYIHSILGIK